MPGLTPTGFLHLALQQRDGRWTSAEVILTRTLGYGTYTFVVRDTSQLDPAAAHGHVHLGRSGADQNHRELDIEISQWGDRSITECAVRRPAILRAGECRAIRRAGGPRHALVPLGARPGPLQNRAWRRSSEGATVAQHEFTSGVPIPGDERVRINLYLFRYAPSPPAERRRGRH